MRNSLLIFAFLILAAFAGCKKEKATNDTNVSNQQAATMVATALAINANGLVSVKNDVTLYAKNLGSTSGKGCGVIDSFAVARQEPTTSLVKYNYAFGYHYTVNCEGGLADNLTSNTIYNGSFDAATLTGINTTNCTLNVINLSNSAAVNYVLTGSYQRSGSFETIDDSHLAGTNVIMIETNDLMVQRSSRGIVSGSATVSVSGNVKNKDSFRYNGTLAFDNTGIAKLLLEGVSYTINLTTADVTAL